MYKYRADSDTEFSNHTLACHVVNRAAFLDTSFAEALFSSWLNQLFPDLEDTHKDCLTFQKISNVNNSSNVEITPETNDLILSIRTLLFPHYLIDENLDSIIKLFNLAETWQNDALDFLIDGLYFKCFKSEMVFENLIPIWNPVLRSLKRKKPMSRESRLKLDEIEYLFLKYYAHKAPLSLLHELIDTEPGQLVMQLGKSVSFYKNFLLHFARAYISKPSSNLLRLYLSLNNEIIFSNTWAKPVSFPLLQAYLTNNNFSFLPISHYLIKSEDPLISWAFIVLERKILQNLLDKNDFSPDEITWLFFLSHPGHALSLLLLENFVISNEFFEVNTSILSLRRSLGYEPS